MGSNQPLGQRIVCGVLAFLLGVFVAGALALAAVYFTLLSPGAFQRAFAHSGYYAGVTQQLSEQLGYQLTPTGLPASVLEGAYSPAQVEELANASLNGTLTDVRLSEVRGDVEAALTQSIYAYLDENGYERSELGTEALESITSTVAASFAGYAVFPAASQLHRVFNTYGRLLPFGLGGFVVLAALCGLLLYHQAGWKHRFLRYASFGAGGGGLMLLAGPVALLAWGGIGRLQLQPQYLYSLVQSLAGTALWVFVVLGLLLLAACAVLALLSEKRRSSMRSRRRRRAGEAA